MRTSHLEPPEAVYHWKKKDKGKISDLKFYETWVCKKTSMLNPVKSLGYIKCDSSSSSRPVKTPSNFIRYNCHKICSWSRRPKRWSTILLLTRFSDFINHRKKTNRVVFLGVDLSPIFLDTATTDETFQVFQVSIKVQAHSSLGPPLGYNQTIMPLTNQGSLSPF